MNRAALLLGGNQGDRHRLLQQAEQLIRERIGTVVAASAVYETEPWGEFEVGIGIPAPTNFLNQALLVETCLEAREVLRTALEIEQTLGRERAESTPPPAAPRRYHSRPIDIDIIFFNHVAIDEPGLQVPHPRMHLRRFVLEPLAEIMPEYRHPLLGETVGQLLAQL